MYNIFLLIWLYFYDCGKGIRKNVNVMKLFSRYLIIGLFESGYSVFFDRRVREGWGEKF